MRPRGRAPSSCQRGRRAGRSLRRSSATSTSL
ncbi:hypothetical protein VHUM_03409 [Vanrija humicola]|uniref:Uncharacterized protein n=1 Tax=Vanrija humicola TaxID=5417 RepID=A0A7D8YWI2_VANHU|nr:hypothetical protein VHUM_03409 [Vanrija humicola]